MPKFSKMLAVALVLPLATGGAAVLGQAADAAPRVPAAFTFSGGGWGHGVGMSQVGAFGMASEGKSADQILKHYYSGATVGTMRDDKEIRVNLRNRTTGFKVRSEALLSGGGGITIDFGAPEVDGDAGDVFAFALDGDQVRVTKNGKTVGSGKSIGIRWAGTRYPSTTSMDDARPTVLNLVDPKASFTTGGHRYRYGTVKVVARATGGVTKIEVTNVLRLHDEYLYGIGEMPSSWPKAALQAQAIAARTFALHKFGTGKVQALCQCHVYNGVRDQNFVGYTKETSAKGANWRAAVNATHKSSTTSKVVVYKGKLAQTFYSASTGGRTQNVKDVWGSNIPYLRSVSDKWSTQKKYNPHHASWGPVARSQKQIAKVFGLPDVKTLDATQRYASGALKSATATSSKGKKVTISGSTFISRTALTSNWIKRVRAEY